MGRGMIRVAMVCVVALLAPTAWAAAGDVDPERRITVHAGEFAPYVSSGEDGPRGVMVELLRAVGQRADVRFDITVLPWQRAQHIVGDQGRHAMIIPLTRTESREPEYDWVVPLLSDPLALMGREASLADMTFGEARDLVVAVQAESPNAELLRERGFRHVQRVPREARAARLIKLGRADAWFARPMVARAVYGSVGGDSDALVSGPQKRTPPMYLAAAKGRFSEQLRDRLRAAFTGLRADGASARILAKY